MHDSFTATILSYWSKLCNSFAPSKIERSNANRKTAIIAQVFEGTQAHYAGLERGDIVCLAGTQGEEELPYDLFLEMAKSPDRPLVFDIRRITTAAAQKDVNRSAEAYNRKQAMIAAAETRERAAKAREKPVKKFPPKPTAIVDINSEIPNVPQSEEARRAVEAAKNSENKLAAELGYNPYETNKTSAGQARNATVTSKHGSVDARAPSSIPAVAPPKSVATATSELKETIPSVDIHFQHAYEETINSNDHAVVVKSFGVMRKLLINATTKGQNINDEESAAKFRKVRLSNATIREVICDVHGALDIMMSCGFQLVEEGGESYLIFPANYKGPAWLARALDQMQNYESL